MNDFLDYVEKYKFAILGTVLVHIIFFFYTTFATLDKPVVYYDPEAEILLPLDDIEFDPKLMEMLELNKKPAEPENVTNVSADENDRREKSYENFSTQEMDEQVENEARDLEQKYFDEWASTHGETSSSSSSSDEDKLDEHRRNNNPDKTTIDTDGSNAVAGEVLVSYNLPSRKSHSLPKPGYTCNSSGTVVIDVKVDKSGNVKTATYNSGRSSGATECMINKAIRYAKKSRFNYSGSAPGSQSGTITYKFVRGK